MKATILLVVKFIVAILFLPIVIASTHAFQSELATFDPAVREMLLQGMASYIILNFFLYDFSAVYKFGQGIVTTGLQFMKPLVNVAPYVLPVYTILVLVVYAVASLLGKADPWQPTFVFLFAFTFSMHIILTAKDLYAKDTMAAKPNYIFGMALIYVLDIFLMALLLGLVVKGFSFTKFFLTLTGTSADIYWAVFKQLFL